MIDGAGDYVEVVEELIRLLFPAAAIDLPPERVFYMANPNQGRWLRERRVAHKHVLRLYLERVEGEGLRDFLEASRLWDQMNCRQHFEEGLRKIEKDRVLVVVELLQSFEDIYSPDRVVPGSIGLLNLLPIIPERKPDFFKHDRRFVVYQIVYRLLRTLPEPAARQAAIEQILSALESLSSKRLLIDLLGNQEEGGSSLIPQEARIPIEKSYRKEVRAATLTQLMKEWELFWVLHFVQKRAEPDEAPVSVEADPALYRTKANIEIPSSAPAS